MWHPNRAQWIFIYVGVILAAWLAGKDNWWVALLVTVATVVNVLVFNVKRPR